MRTKSRAITLIELLISTVIVGIVIAGIFSAEYALRRANRDISQDVQISAQIRAVAEAIRIAARRLHGDLTANGTGYTRFNANSFCFRYDATSTPDDFSDDLHTCFTMTAQGNVNSCDRPSPGSCGAISQFVGRLVRDQLDFNISPIPAPRVVTNADGTYYFEMLLVGRLDPSVGASCLPMPEGTCQEGETLGVGTAGNPQVAVRLRQTPISF